MTFLAASCLFFSGLIAGFINIVAGGGSLLTVPALIFFGLPPTVANATNRVGVLIQSIVSIAAFRKEGISEIRYSFLLSLPATAGALIGTQFAVRIRDDSFQFALSVILLAVMALILWNPAGKMAGGRERFQPIHKFYCSIAFFFIGMYGGFIQIGVGLIIIAVITNIHNLSLLKTNCIKLTVISIYTAFSVILFTIHGKIDWFHALVLSAGYAAGGWTGSKLSIKKGDAWIKKILVACVLVMSLKLSGGLDKLISLF